jgi:hypothetical protein
VLNRVEEEEHMREGKIIGLLFIAALLFTGCASRIGYPAKAVGIPTPVTLFSSMPEKGTITKNLDYFSKEAWTLIYQKKFENNLSQISTDRLLRSLNVRFGNNAAKATDLFALSSTEVLNTSITYSKTKSDPPSYSGFDFSQYKATIPTPYILALTIDEWGIIASKKNEENGPYVSLTMQLIDKETNASLWRYSYLFQEPVDKDANELTKVSALQDIYEHLIPRAVDAYFMWLGYK